MQQGIGTGVINIMGKTQPGILGTYLPMPSLLGPSLILPFPDAVALFLVQQANVLGPFDIALHQQGMWAQPLDHQVVLVRDAGRLDFNVICTQRLADVCRRRPHVGGPGRAHAAGRMGSAEM